MTTTTTIQRQVDLCTGPPGTILKKLKTKTKKDKNRYGSGDIPEERATAGNEEDTDEALRLRDSVACKDCLRVDLLETDRQIAP